MSSPRNSAANIDAFESSHPPNHAFWRNRQMHTSQQHQSPWPWPWTQQSDQNQHQPFSHLHPQQLQSNHHQRAQSSVSQLPPTLPPIPRVASTLDSSSSSDSRPRPAPTNGTPQDHAQLAAQERIQLLVAQDRSQLSAHERAQLAVQDRRSLSAHERAQLAAQDYVEKMLGFPPLQPPPVTTTPSDTASSSPSSQLPLHPQRLARRSVTSPDGLLTASSPHDSVSPTTAASSATLGVPYSSTMMREKPRSGDRPLVATTTVNGIPQHLSKSHLHKHDHPSPPPPPPPPSHPAPPSKSRRGLNLLNPVTLLMRRRSNQAVETISDKSSAKSPMIPPMDLPDDYDPRIKGNMIHDFSVPRPRRNLSYNDAVGSAPILDVSFGADHSGLDPIQQSPTDLSPSEPDPFRHQRRKSSQHTPVFVEHFDHDQPFPTINAESLANSKFLTRNSWQGGQFAAPPPFGRKSQRLDEQQVYAAVNPPPIAEETKTPSSRSSDPASLSSFTSCATSAPDHPQTSAFRISDQSHLSPDTAPTVDSRPVSKHLNLTGEPPSPPLVVQSSSTSEYASPQSTSPQRMSPGASEGRYFPAGLSPPSNSGGLRHLPSSASRFSFQIASMDSMAEEKLLEDKHKQRHSMQTGQSVNLPGHDNDDGEDDEDEFFDEDAMYDHDEMEGLEEPEVFSGNNVFQNTHNQSDSQSVLAAGVAGLHFSDVSSSLPRTASPPMSPAARQTTLPSTPGKQIKSPTEAALSFMEHTQRSPPFQLASEDMPAKPTSPISPNSFYFDDGMVDGLDDVHDGPRDRDGNIFDEDKFDDDSFLKRLQPHAEEPTSSQSPLGQSSNTYSVNGYAFQMHNPPNHGFGKFASESPYSEQSLDRGESVARPPPTEEPFRHDSHSQIGQCQTPQERLSAYHSALAEAAHKAAADGRFTRQTSTATSASRYSDEQDAESSESPQAPDKQVTSDPEFVIDNARPTHSDFDFDLRGHNRFSSLEEVPSDDFGYRFPPDDNDYDFDDADLIAAANAEALSADDSGMYSQEFGFYAKPRPGSAEDGEDNHGGYFGPPGIEIQRQKSGRAPNLTPITERSEFSTRNSFIAGPGNVGGPWSPTSFAGSAQGLPSPALSTTMSLAQQRGMSPLNRSQMPENENMTLAEIRKGLHANAYAGSNGSINSDFGPAVSSSPAEFGSGRPFEPIFPNAAPSGVPGAGFFMPVPRGGNQTISGIGGVPMAWQRSTESHNSQQSYSSSPVIPPSPAHPTVPAVEVSMTSQSAQAQAFSFFDAGDDDDGNAPNANTNLTVDGGDGSKSVTPRKVASPSYQQQDMASSSQTSSTARKASPAVVATPGYTSVMKPSLGSPLKLESFAPPRAFSDSPPSANSALAQGNPPLYSPLASPKSCTSPENNKRISGADSVTYVQERDSTTGTKRWVLERRRMSEQGFAELIGREIVEGGRI